MEYRTFLVWATLLICLASISVSEGATVAVFKSKDSGMYNRPIPALKSVCKGTVKEYSMNGKAAEGKKIAEKMNASKPDVVVAVGTAASKIAKSDINPSIPIVYCLVTNPGKYGLQGGNITGVALKIPMKMQLETLKQIYPKLARLGIVYNPSRVASTIKEAKEAAGQIGITLVTKEVSDGSEVPDALESMKGTIDALYLPPDKTLTGEGTMQFMMLFTIQNKLPFLVPSGKFVKQGGLLALNPDFDAIGRQTANLVNKILGNASPSDLPPEFPTEIQLIINQKTMQQIGIQVPQELLSKAKMY